MKSTVSTGNTQSGKHPFWQLGEKENKSDTERIAFVAMVRLLSTQEGYYHRLDGPQLYDTLLREASKVYQMNTVAERRAARAQKRKQRA